MVERVEIIGVGFEGFRPSITDLSTRELMYEAASKAYHDAGVDPRKDIGSFISCTEDLWEGWSIADEMVPDQLGGAGRPVCTVPADGIVGLGHAIMHIRSGVADVVAVEAHSKVADVLDKTAVENLALDPVFHRATGANSDVLAGLEMSSFMEETGTKRGELSQVVRSAKRKAMRNGRASYGATLELEEIDSSEPLALPLRRLDRPEFAEAAVVIVLASGSWAKRHRKDGVFIDGLSWRSATPWFEAGGVKTARYMQDSYRSVMKQSGLRDLSQFDVLEVDDSYSFKLVQHLMSMGVSKVGVMGMLKEGTALNPSGGSLGTGHLIEATGSHKVLECVLQVRGTAGGNQAKGVGRAFASSWRGNPTGAGAAIALSVGN
ncbi:MAG: hypothetical protein HY297_00420 [Thaumarchaeota archaeon]|nr:hypothetical protein [Nitrososphaerota archaeon]